MKVTYEAVGFTADIKLKQYIEKKLSKLDQFYNRIIEGKATLKLENSGQVKDKIVEVELKIPGENIFQKNIDKTFEASLDGLIDSLKRALIKHKEMARPY